MDHDRRTIAEEARICSDLFYDGLEIFEKGKWPAAWAQLRDQFGRFNMWATNIGVFATAVHATMDYRLKDLPDARDIVIDNLGVIAGRLRQFRPPSLEDESTRPTPDADNELDTSSRLSLSNRHPGLTEDEIQQIIQVISDYISWLHKLSNTIRRASSVRQNLKATANPMNDEERISLENMFSSWIRREFPAVTDKLRKRLAKTMLLRRRRVLYRRSRQAKLKQVQVVPRPQKQVARPNFQEVNSSNEVAQVSLERNQPEIPPQPQSGSFSYTATTIDPEAYRRTLRPPSRHSEVRTLSLSNQDKLMVSRPPKLDGRLEFICPYCSLVRPSEEAKNGDKWAEHVKKDSEPYVCLFDECSNADAIFSTSKEWISHMRTQHLMRWRCVAKTHAPIVFDSPTYFEAHMRSDHQGRFGEDQLQFITESSGRPVGPTFTTCPFCGEDSGNLEDHVGRHLHYIALQSLPFPEDYDSGSSSDGGSNPSTGYTASQSSTRKDYDTHMPVPQFTDRPATDELRPHDDLIPEYLVDQHNDSKTGSLRRLTWIYVPSITDSHLPLGKHDQSYDPVLQDLLGGQLAKQKRNLVDVLDSLSARSTLHETPGSPYLLTELRSHQKQGLTFMISRESGWKLHQKGQDVWSQSNDNLGRITYINNIDSSSHYEQPSSFRGGIIADEMGLGKTLSMISLIAHDKVLEKGSGPAKSSGKILGRGTLVVLPPPLLHNWEAELSGHLSAEHFTWRRHHGPQRIQETSDVGFYDIILTTYTTLAKEWQLQERESPVFSHDWHRVVLDEAHQIGNLSTSKARAARALRADCRWVVTGTPIQNRLSELFSLIHFLRLYPYCERRSFDEGITNPWLLGEDRGLQALVKLLGYIMLRRAEIAIILPGRHDHRRFLKLNAKEQHTYDIMKQQAIECLEDALVSNKPQEGYRNALQKINALRVICELGCLPKPGIQSPLSNSVAYESLPRPGTPDGSSAPSASAPSMTIDDIRDDDCGLETDENPFGDTSSHLFPSDPSTELPLSSSQWPTKIQALIEDLQSCAVGTKCVVLSYRTPVLNVANLALKSAGIQCVQVDGKSSFKKRREIGDAFLKNEAVRVLLLSLGCAAVGLTLTGASRAYLLEPQWSPSIEEQAIARIHRLGQTQEVTTIRFVISGSIEENVLDAQDGNQDLISLLSSNPATGSQVTAKLQQLRQLLR